MVYCGDGWSTSCEAVRSSSGDSWECPECEIPTMNPTSLPTSSPTIKQTTSSPTANPITTTSTATSTSGHSSSSSSLSTTFHFASTNDNTGGSGDTTLAVSTTLTGNGGSGQGNNDNNGSNSSFVENDLFFVLAGVGGLVCIICLICFVFYVYIRRRNRFLKDGNNGNNNHMSKNNNSVIGSLLPGLPESTTESAQIEGVPTDVNLNTSSTNIFMQPGGLNINLGWQSSRSGMETDADEINQVISYQKAIELANKDMERMKETKGYIPPNIANIINNGAKAITPGNDNDNNNNNNNGDDKNQNNNNKATDAGINIMRIRVNNSSISRKKSHQNKVNSRKNSRNNSRNNSRKNSRKNSQNNREKIANVNYNVENKRQKSGNKLSLDNTDDNADTDEVGSYGDNMMTLCGSLGVDNGKNNFSNFNDDNDDILESSGSEGEKSQMELMYGNENNPRDIIGPASVTPKLDALSGNPDDDFHTYGLRLSTASAVSAANGTGVLSESNDHDHDNDFNFSKKKSNISARINSFQKNIDKDRKSTPGGP